MLVIVLVITHIAAFVAGILLHDKITSKVKDKVDKL